MRLGLLIAEEPPAVAGSRSDVDRIETAGSIPEKHRTGAKEGFCDGLPDGWQSIGSHAHFFPCLLQAVVRSWMIS